MNGSIQEPYLTYSSYKMKMDQGQYLWSNLD